MAKQPEPTKKNSSPTNATVGEQNFTLYGSRESHSYQFNNGVHRFEVRPGDRENDVWQDGNDIERSQMDGGYESDWRTPPDLDPGPGSADIDYLIVTKFVWTPRQNMPGGAEWSNLWEWHHVNNQQPINRAPIRIGAHQGSNNSRPLFLYLASFDSRDQQMDNPNSWESTDIQLMNTPPANVPIEFEEHVRFHESDGIYRLYVNGKLAYERTNAMVGYCDTQHYPQFGWYRSTAGSSGQNSVSEFTFPDANKRFSRQSLDYSIDGGDGGTDPAPPNPGPEEDKMVYVNITVPPGVQVDVRVEEE